jgi:hypothetical protein
MKPGIRRIQAPRPQVRELTGEPQKLVQLYYKGKVSEEV